MLTIPSFTAMLPFGLLCVACLPNTAKVATSDATASDATATTRVFAVIVSHNEQDNNAKCQPVLNDAQLWRANRDATLAFADAVVAGGGAWDLQSDFRWIEQMHAWERDEERSKTAGMNVLRYLATTSGGRISVDPHNHDGSHNYADVAWLLEQAGVPDTGVAGGFIWYPSTSADWERFKAPLTGLAHPEHAWQPHVLWGPATHQHSGPDSEASGVWRPLAVDDFHAHDPSGDLVAMGNYVDTKYEIGGGAGIGELLSALRAGEFPDGVMVTAAVFFDQCGFSEEDVAAVTALLERYAPDVASGDLVWATIPEIVDTWREQYAERPFVYNAPPSAGSECPPGQVACDAGPCNDTCVSDCRTTEQCPNGTSCDDRTGLCVP